MNVPSSSSSILRRVAQQRLAADPALAERARAARAASDVYRDDVARFIDAAVIIDDAQPGNDATDLAEIPFHLWPAQSDLLTDIAHERLLLILKARQLGISWLVLAYALWLCLYRPGRLVLIFSIGQDEANEMLRRVHVMYWRLNDALRRGLPVVTKDNTEEMAWANGSRVLSLPARKTAGSGYTASLVVLDEFAKNERATEIYTAVKPTIDGGGKMIVLSSAHGTGNLFHEMCERAQKGTGRFIFRFLPWQSRPGRDDAWYADVAADAVQSSLMGQEYPATPEEAFSATNAERFLPSILWWDACRADLPPLDARTPLVLAADAGVSNDYFALVGTTRHPERREDIAVRLVQVWRPGGRELDFDAIEGEIDHICAQYNVIQLAYDKYQLHQMMQRLGRHVWTDAFSQQAERLEADKSLLDLIQAKRITHDGNADLRQALDNADRQIDQESRKLRIVKRRDDLKIDAAVSLSMSAYRCLELNV
jgi:terminase large subunit-like protein